MSGKELFERRMNNWKISFNDDLLAYLVKHYKKKNISEFFTALGNSTVDILDVKSVIQSKDSSVNSKVSVEPV